MPKEMKYFRDFSKGIITNLDDNDLPDDAVGWGPSCRSSNFLFTKMGSLESIKKPKAIKDTAGDDFSHHIISHAILPRRDGSYSLVYSANHFILMRDNFTANSIDPFTTLEGGDLHGNSITKGSAVRIGRDYGEEPYFVGEVISQPFHGRYTFTPNTDTSYNTLEINAGQTTNDTDKTVTINITATNGVSTFTNWNLGAYPKVIIGRKAVSLTRGNYIVITDSGFLYTDEMGDTAQHDFDGTYEIMDVDGDSTTDTFTIYVDEDTYTRMGNVDGGDAKEVTFVSDLAEFNYTVDGNTSSAIEILPGKKYTLGTNNGANGYNLIITFTDPSVLEVDDEWEIELNGKNYTLEYGSARLDNLHDEEEKPVVAGSFSGTGGVFSSDKRYYYAYSLIYDDLQHSPIEWNLGNSYVPASDSGKFKGKVDIKDMSILSKRITGITVWRAESDKAEYKPGTYFREVKTIWFNLGGWSVIEDGVRYSYSFTDEGALGSSYEGLTGIPETEFDTLPKYKLIEELNDRAFVASFTHPYFEKEGRFMIARSQINAYDSFNMQKDILKLPEEIVALKAYNGKLYAFGDSRTYVINYELFVEDVVDGFTTTNHRTVTEGKEGLFIANNRGLFLYNRGGRTELSYPIRNEWKSPDFIVYDAINDLILVADDTDPNYWVYSLRHKAWSYFDYTDVYVNSYYGLNFLGHVFLFLSREEIEIDMVRNLAGDTNYDMNICRPWNAGTPEEDKKYYMIIWENANSQGDVTVDGDTRQYTSGESMRGLYGPDLWPRGKSVTIHLAADELKQIAIMFRRLIGVRR